jgi:RNA polymerase sigma-70 factor (ECF subfamily)
MHVMSEKLAMNGGDPEFIPTRQSLLSRLKDCGDHESWRTFFDTYWKLIYKTAKGTGLTEEEAEDVVQETMFSISKMMPDFEYKEAGSFKKWLMQLTAWRIKDVVRKRPPGDKPSRTRAGDFTRTATIDKLIDPNGTHLGRLWDEEWKHNLLEVALDRVKQKVDPKQYQIFDFYVLKEWPLSRVTKAMNVNAARVYLAKHRINALIKKEIAKLQSKPV